jgi:TolB-like protein
LLVLVAGTLWLGPLVPARRAAPTRAEPASVGVMPFLDLTVRMDGLILSDELTEGVVDKLSQNPALRTPSFRASILLRGKRLAPTEAAKRLGVAYVLDGGLHSLGGGLRVTARLSRADNGFVVWSGAYELPAGDLAPVEDAIAAGVAKTLAGNGSAR